MRVPIIRTMLALLAGLAGIGPLQAAELDRGLPEDTNVVVRINLRQVLESPLVKKYALKEIEKAISGSKEMQQASMLLGLDPLKDVHSITLASPGGKDEKKFVAIVQGSFDLAKIHDTADKVAKDADKLLIHKQGNVRFYEAKAKGESVFGAFLSRELLIVSPDRSYVSDAIARSAGDKPPKLNENLKSLVGKQDGKQSLWIATVVTAEMKAELAKIGQAKPFADKLQSISAGITVGDDIKIKSLIQTSDADSAKQIRDVFNALKALATLLVTGNQELKEFAPMIQDVLNSFKTTQEQNTVGLELTISAAVIEKGVKMAMQR